MRCVSPSFCVVLCIRVLSHHLSEYVCRGLTMQLIIMDFIHTLKHRTTLLFCYDQHHHHQHCHCHVLWWWWWCWYTFRLFVGSFRFTTFLLYLQSAAVLRIFSLNLYGLIIMHFWNDEIQLTRNIFEIFSSDTLFHYSNASSKRESTNVQLMSDLHETTNDDRFTKCTHNTNNKSFHFQNRKRKNIEKLVSCVSLRNVREKRGWYYKRESQRYCQISNIGAK